MNNDDFLIDDEGHIDEMIKKGISIVNEAIEQYKPIHIISAYSGGNDSIVSTHFACTNFSAQVLHCNTQVGIERTRQHVRNTCTKFGWNLHERLSQPEGKQGTWDAAVLPSGKWTDGKTAYEEFVLNFGFPGPRQHGRMYQRLKERPLYRYITEIKSSYSRLSCVLIISGIRHDESSIRAGYKRAVQKDGSKIWVNPFYFNTYMDFEMYRQEFGLPRNPVSDQIGFSGECLCGAFAKSGEKELVRQVEPETAAYLDDLESRVKQNGYPWGWGESIPRWWADKKRGQGFLFELEEFFQPMCVGCPRRRQS